MVGGGTPVGSQGRRAGHLQLQGTGAAYGQRKCGGRPHARRGSACPARIHGGGTCTMWCFWHGERRLRGSVALGGQRMSSAFLSCVGRVEGFLAGHAACGMRSASLEVRQNCRLKAVNWFCSDSSPWPRGDVHCMVRFWAFNASVSIASIINSPGSHAHRSRQAHSGASCDLPVCFTGGSSGTSRQPAGLGGC